MPIEKEMKSLPRPTNSKGQQFDPGNVFDTCISHVNNNDLKKRMRAISPKVKEQSEAYALKGGKGQIYLISPCTTVGRVTKDELMKVYSGRMVPKASQGRPIYDRILSRPVHLRCPFCGIGTVNTLDHYLPKSHFPIFSVTPNNLVPSCQWCQANKKEYFPKAKGGQILHPYFDKIDDEIWLVAEIDESKPATFLYSASPPAKWTASQTARVKLHLRKLGLQKLFSSNAGSRLCEIRFELERLHEAAGECAVKRHLREQLRSIEKDWKNSWVAAMYRAAAASLWVCNGGFR